MPSSDHNSSLNLNKHNFASTIISHYMLWRHGHFLFSYALKWKMHLDIMHMGSSLKSSNLVNFLRAVFVTAQDGTVNVGSLAVFPWRINGTDQVFFSITTAKPEDALLYLCTIIINSCNNNDKNIAVMWKWDSTKK